MEQEIQLQGGNVSGGVIRIGETLHRPMGPWSPGVHALLRHLEARGFDGVPRFLVIDQQGREILTFIDGEIGHYPLVMRKFAMLEDLLGESWTYNEIIRRGYVKGEKEGIEKERQEWLHAQREALLNVVQMRFPGLLTEATERAASIGEPLVLQNTMLKIMFAQSDEEARNFLLELK